jgi:hypothetical protein
MREGGREGGREGERPLPRQPRQPGWARGWGHARFLAARRQETQHSNLSPRKKPADDGCKKNHVEAACIILLLQTLSSICRSQRCNVTWILFLNFRLLRWSCADVLLSAQQRAGSCSLACLLAWWLFGSCHCCCWLGSSCLYWRLPCLLVWHCCSGLFRHHAGNAIRRCWLAGRLADCV